MINKAVDLVVGVEDVAFNEGAFGCGFGDGKDIIYSGSCFFVVRRYGGSWGKTSTRSL